MELKEYVGCKSIHAANSDVDGDDLYCMWLTDTEIVRCRDCEHWREVPMSDRSIGHYCSGVFAFIEPRPDGFCAWAKRREPDQELSPGAKELYERIMSDLERDER